MRRAIVILILVLGVGGCRTGLPKTEPVPVGSSATASRVEEKLSSTEALVVDDGQPVEVTLKVEAVTQKGQGVVESGEVLRSGDKIAIHVDVSATSYVYVALVSSDGSQSLLFPKSGDAIIKAGQHERIPPAGQWFKLDKNAGQEDVFVYASKRALTSEDVLARVKAEVEQVRARPAVARKKAVARVGRASTQDAPSAMTPETRGLELEEESPAARDGFTQKHFSIRHAK